MTDERLIEIKGMPHKIHAERDLIAEIDRLHERIEQLEYLEARSAAEAKAERKRAEFWKRETEKRAGFLLEIERGGCDISGEAVCPECTYWTGHAADCPMPILMTMPEEPKP